MKTFSLSSLKDELKLVPLTGESAIAQAIACKVKFVSRSRIMNDRQGIQDLLFRADSSETRNIFTQMISEMIEELSGVTVDEIDIVREDRTLSIEVSYIWDETSYLLSVGIGSETTNKQGYFA